MCTFILLKNKEITIQSELAEFLESEDFIFDKIYGDVIFEPDVCLCPVDIPKTLDKFRIEFEQDDFMFYYCIPTVRDVWGDDFDVQPANNPKGDSQ